MRRRLVASYLAITVGILAVLIVPLGRTFATREQDRLLRDIQHDATVVAGLSEDALERGTRPPLDALLADYARDPGGRIVVVDRNGKTVADSASDRKGTDFTNRPEIASAIAGVGAEGRRRSDTLGTDLLYVATPVASSGVVHGAVRVTYPSSTLDRRVRAMWIGLAALSLVVLAVVTLVGIGLARLVTRPVSRLKDAAQRIAAGDLSARASTDGGAPELRELATVFNDTAQHQQDLLDAQRAFVADASHQLRTPLAALRLQLENIESRAPLDLQPSLASAQSETARLGRISEGLLALTRSTAATTQPEPVDASELGRQRRAVWEPIAVDNGVQLVLQAPEHAWVSATPGAVEQILDNLIDNALDVAPSGSTLRISVRPEHEVVEIHVVDEGPGLDDEQRVRAFDRFWRAPTAPSGGTGLGLAIVAQLAAASSGTAELRPAPEHGIDAVVSLPASGAPTAD
jgi:signal transduction histidine kinase